MGEYIPQAPVNDEAKKANGNLANGGVYNPVNFHVYHYANNNPIKYSDPDGRIPFMVVTGIVGALIGGGASIASDLMSGEDVNWAKAGAYAVAGGFAGATLGGVAATVATGSALTAGSATASFSTVTGVGTATVAQGGGSIWALDKFSRGWEAERLLGGMMNNFPTIDKFILGAKGIASSVTSIKSMDLAAKTYQKGSAIVNKLGAYINKVANFKTGSLGSLTVTADSATKKILELAIPKGATPEQLKAINESAAYATQKGVELIIKVIE